MIRFYYFLTLAMIALFTALPLGCAKSGATVDPGAHRKEIRDWQKTRLKNLTKDDGWLTLCGLFWLKEGENTFGSDTANAIVFPPGKTPARAGSIWLEHGALRMEARPGAQIRHGDSAVASMVLTSDGEGASDPTILDIGTIRFYVIKRGEQLGVRVKDKENPARVNFKDLAQQN